MNVSYLQDFCESQSWTEGLGGLGGLLSGELGFFGLLAGRAGGAHEPESTKCRFEG